MYSFQVILLDKLGGSQISLDIIRNCAKLLLTSRHKMETKKDFSCGGVVLNENDKKMLLVKVQNLSKSIVWTFPKGHPEKGETDEQAALREVHEETGWECEIVKPLLDTQYFYTQDKISYQKTVRWFLMRPLKETRKPMEGEILECMWASVAEANIKISYESDRKLLSLLGF